MAQKHTIYKIMAENKKKQGIGTIMLISGIIGFILDSILVSNLMVIKGNAAVIIIGFLLAILLFLLSLILTISGIAMIKEARTARKRAKLAASNPGMIIHSDAVPIANTPTKAKSTTSKKPASAVAKKTVAKKSTVKKSPVKAKTTKKSSTKKV